MNYISTKNKSTQYSIKDAIISGLPNDNGLYIPAKIPSFPSEIIDQFKGNSLSEIAYTVLLPYFSEEIESDVLKGICDDTFNFEIPLTPVTENIYSLELYHGPTLAFKDIGARFLARCLSYFAKNENKKVKVIVATSGDTGSAVAHGFYNLENIEVVILYPKGRISDLQEKQMTCLGGNITALRVDGNFDDCQRLVKTAFLDTDLRKKIKVTSANSINIARFIPQSVYYYYALSQLPSKLPVTISVPSGNFGNLTAGLYAKQTGLSIDKFIASTNINKVFTDYLETGEYTPVKSKKSISNAMDVGDPSNLARIQSLFPTIDDLRKEVISYSFTDEETRDTIKAVFNKSGYILDPHGAVGYLGLKKHLDSTPTRVGVFLETAHPIKFRETVEPVIGKTIDIPNQLIPLLDRKSHYTDISSEYTEFKSILLGC